MNKEGLAKIYANSKFKNCMYGCDPNILTDYDSIKDGFTAGFNAAEKDIIAFTEWCSENYINIGTHWIRKTGTREYQSEQLTTDQLLEKFRVLPAL